MRRGRFLAPAAISSTLLTACGQPGDVVSSARTTVWSATTTDVPTTTSATVDSTSISLSTASSSTPSTTVAPAQIELGPDGLSETLKFGMDGDEAVDAVSAALGPPSHDEWQEFVLLDTPSGDNLYGDAEDGLGLLSEYPWYRMTCWDTLCLEMDSTDGSSSVFAGWYYGSEIDRPGYHAELADLIGEYSTPSGVTIGTTWGDVRAEHPEVTVDWGEGWSIGFTLPGWNPSFNHGVAGTGVLDFDVGLIDGFEFGELFPDDIPDNVAVMALFVGDALEYGCC